MALNFNIAKTNRLFSNKNAVFIIGILTTFSTAGYIALYTAITLYFLYKEKRIYKYIIIPVVIFISLFTYQNLSFLGNKIKTHYDIQVIGRQYTGRFGSTLINISEFLENPISGRGLIKDTRYDSSEYNLYGEVNRENLNSISNLLVQLGLLGFIIYIITLLKSIKTYFCRNLIFEQGYLIIIVTLFIVLSSQPIIFSTFFISLLFINELNSDEKYITKS
jgi:hypothetical protein